MNENGPHAITGAAPPRELLDFFRNRDGFFIVVHLNPDGDALGSACALGMALETMGKKFILVCRDEVPSQYIFLPCVERFLTFSSIASAGLDCTAYKNLVLVDCNHIKRTGLEKSALASLKFPVAAVIDHHEIDRSFGEINWIVPQFAATGVMVFYLIGALGIKMTEAMAANLYAAIIVDTGNFRYPNTSPEVLRIAANLAESGAKPYRIYKEINESWSEGRFRLFAMILGNTSIENGIAISHVTRRMFEETLTTPDDTENFASFALTVKDVKIAAFMREVDDYSYKLSLRSTEGINVERIAVFYGGGGHKNAAGCIMHGDLDSVKAELMHKLMAILPTAFRTALQE